MKESGDVYNRTVKKSNKKHTALYKYLNYSQILATSVMLIFFLNELWVIQSSLKKKRTAPECELFLNVTLSRFLIS